MSNFTHLRRGKRAGIAFVAVLLAFVAVPVAAPAAPVSLATVSPFVVLGGSTVTNSGPSVLNGNLGVSPGTALVGFGLPAVVNGATHANNGVAQQAQADLTIAYTAAEGQPVPPGNVLTGTNLGERTLAPGAYEYTSSAQLTGALTLDAEGDAGAQFVFKIGSALTTAPASSVILINGASPCNVFWQVTSSATIDTTTAFQGNLMALTDITLNSGASVKGRMLARNGQVSLINNVLDASMCGANTTPPDATPVNPGASDDGVSPGVSPGVAVPVDRRRRPRVDRTNGTAIARRVPNARGPNIDAPDRDIPKMDCTAGFRATVRGHKIDRVVFRLDGRRIDSQRRSPFRVFVRAAPGRHVIGVRVTFKDNTRAKTMTLPYRACASAVLTPRPGPSQFTG